MAKTESTLKNMLLTLLGIAIISGVSLGAVYTLTKTPIEQAKQAKQQEAIKLVVPPFDNDPAAEAIESTTAEGVTLKMFPAKKDGQLVGTAVESATNKGFSGEIKVMVGFAPDGTIINYKVLDHKETPGLGSKMDEWFRPAIVTAESIENQKPSFFKWLFGIKTGSGGDRRVIEKNPAQAKLTVTKDGGEIDAITAATISSRAFLDAVRVAYEAYNKQNQTQPADSTATATDATATLQEGGQQ
jgi:Na+-translocating ferredoxin:NAD+ oxidoreductase subunit G